MINDEYDVQRDASLILGDNLQSMYVSRPLRCSKTNEEVVLRTAGPFRAIAFVLVAFHSVGGVAVSLIMILVLQLNKTGSLVLGSCIVGMGIGLAVIYWLVNKGGTNVLVYDGTTRSLVARGISGAIARDDVQALKYYVSRVTDDRHNSGSRMDVFFAELLLEYRDAEIGVHQEVVACCFGIGWLNCRAVRQFASSIGCPSACVRMSPEHRITRSSLKKVIRVPF